MTTLLFADDQVLIPNTEYNNLHEAVDKLIQITKYYNLTINQLTPWLMKPRVSIPHSQRLTDNFYPKPNQPNSSYRYIFL
jgi:hypothetical protein